MPLKYLYVFEIDLMYSSSLFSKKKIIIILFAKEYKCYKVLFYSK